MLPAGKSSLGVLVLFMVLFSSIHGMGQGIGDKWLVEDVSFKSFTGESVYPGSRNTRLAVSTRYIGVENAINPIACIYLPPGFQVAGSGCSAARDADNNLVNIVSQGMVVYYAFVLNIDRDVKPGYFTAGLNITYYNSATNMMEWSYIEINLHISEYPSLDIEIRDVYFSPLNNPGACPVYVVVGLINNGVSNIESMRLTLELPVELTEPSTINYTYPYRLNPGGEVYISLGPLCIDPNISPNTSYVGSLLVDATLSTTDGVLYSDTKTYNITLHVGEHLSIKIKVLTYELTSGVNYSGLRNTGLRILVESLEPQMVELTYSVLELESAVSLNNSNIAVYSHTLTLNYGETSWITYSGLSISDNATYVRVKITIYGFINRMDASTPASIVLTIVVPIAPRDLNIDVLYTSWSTKIAYPGSVSSLIISIINNETSVSLIDSIVELEWVEGDIYPKTQVVYNVALTPGSIVEVEFSNIIIPNTVKPGIYKTMVKLTGILRAVDYSFREITIYRDAYVVIAGSETLEPVLPVFELIDIYWGEGVPQYVYPGNPRASLSIVLQNRGIIPVSNTIILVKSIYPGNVNTLSNYAACSPQLAPGSTCIAMFYLDLSSASSGLIKLDIAVRFTLPALGVNTVFSQTLHTQIYLPSFPAGDGVQLATSGWLNNYPVFPRSRRAVFSSTMVNLEPYPVSSIWVTFNTPACISVSNSSGRTTYVAGPVPSLQTFTFTFTLDLNCKPGSHTAFLEVDYYVQVAGGGVRRKTTYTVELYIQSEENSIEYITSGWLSTPVSPPVNGAQLYLVFRNSRFPTISSPVLKLTLPTGIVESKTNSSEPLVMPVRGIAPQQIPQIQDIQVFITQLLSQNIQQLAMPSSFNKGDLILYIVSLNIDRSDRSFSIPYEIRFIDHWGEEYTIKSVVNITLISTPPILNVYPRSPLIVFSNGTAVLDITIENQYDESVSNMYIALVPASGNVVPQGSIKYIERLHGKSAVNTRFELVYNPVTISIGGVPVSMSSAVFTIGVIYVDHNGVLHTFNTTLVVMIKPFIELTILPGITARYSKGSLVVSGVIANIGISRALSAIIYVNYSGVGAVSIIGDLDPSSQSPFRVELKAPYEDDECVVIIKYRDEYGIEYFLREQLEVVKIEETVTPAEIPQQQDIAFRVIIVVIISVFLMGLFYVLYRHSTQIMKRFSHGSS
ncbi:MAG: hypothetical protein QXE81_01570 [Desulfurococcaceae archaeon]